MKKFLILLLLSFNCYSEPINIFVTSTPGGGIDLFAREVGKILTESGYENVIINQGGAGGDIAYNSTMSKENNSILVGALQNFAFSHVINKRENFHIKTMKIIAPVVEPTFVFLTNKSGFNSFSDMIQYAKNNITPCGVPGGGIPLELEKINYEYGTKFEAIVYKGSNQVKMDLLSKVLNCAFDGYTAYSQDYKLGSIKVLAASKNNIGTPIIRDTLKRNYTYYAWWGIGIPNGSKLLNDDKFMNIMVNLYKNDIIKSFVTQHDLTLDKPNPNINTHITEISDTYKKFIK